MNDPLVLVPCFWVGLVFCKDSNSKLATPHNSRSTIKVGTILKLQASYYEYLKVLSSNTSGLEAHVGIYRLLMKGIFDADVP